MSDNLQMIEEKFLEMSAQLKEVSEEVHDIKNALVGNELIKDDKGFSGKIDDHEKRINTLEKNKLFLIALALAAAAFGGWGVTDFIMKLFLKQP